MIKINLLPSHIHQRRQVKIAVTLVVAMVAAEVAGMVMARAQPSRDIVALQSSLDEKNARIKKLNDSAGKATTARNDEDSFKPKYDFITGMLDYNKKYPALYRNTAHYTDKEVMFLTLESTTNSLKFNAYVSNPTDLSRMMLGLSRDPDFDGLPQVSGNPGYDSSEEVKRQQQENGIIPESGVIGGEIVGGAGGNSPGGMNGGAAMPGMPGGMNGMGGGSARVLPGMAGAAPTGPPPGMPGMGGMSGMGGMNGAGGGNGPGGAGAQESGDLKVLKILAAMKKPKGFLVTVSCALKSPISRPNYGTADSQAGGGGGGGGGGMPGMPGMGGPGGGMGGPMPGMTMPGGPGMSNGPGR
jgi:hypothetical protein